MTTSGVAGDTAVFLRRYPLFFRLDAPQRIGPGSYPQRLIVNMRINFRSVQMFMSQHLLNRLYIHTVLQHQRSCSVAELVRGILGADRKSVV